MKSYSEKEIRAIFKQQGYKYASLKDAEGKVRVTYNTESTKGGASSKVDEAFKRLEAMPDGIYTFCFLNSKGRNVQADEYGFLKGNFAMDEQGKNIPYHIINQMPARQHESDKVLGYTEVLNLKMELATITFERNQLAKELDKANLSVLELKKELDELDSKQPLAEDSNSPMKYIENLSAMAMPILDRYMGLKERELSLQERQKQASRPQKKTIQKYIFPAIDSPEFQTWLDNLEKASDEDFNRTLEIVKSKSMIHYNAINEAFSDDEETEEQEGNQE